MCCTAGSRQIPRRMPSAGRFRSRKETAILTEDWWLQFILLADCFGHLAAPHSGASGGRVVRRFLTPPLIAAWLHRISRRQTRLRSAVRTSRSSHRRCQGIVFQQAAILCRTTFLAWVLKSQAFLARRKLDVSAARPACIFITLQCLAHGLRRSKCAT